MGEKETDFLVLRAPDNRIVTMESVCADSSLLSAEGDVSNSSAVVEGVFSGNIWVVSGACAGAASWLVSVEECMLREYLILSLRLGLGQDAVLGAKVKQCHEIKRVVKGVLIVSVMRSQYGRVEIVAPGWMGSTQDLC